MLWIAFKICIFDFQKQQRLITLHLRNCCELLSKFVSLTFRNSWRLLFLHSSSVVNCFQNLYLWLSETAILVVHAITLELWIAFKICIFDFQKQLCAVKSFSLYCCELLSKFVSLTFRNSNELFKLVVFDVVNCFQNLYLWLSETAVYWKGAWKLKLWIAFKICIFDFQKQHWEASKETT